MKKYFFNIEKFNGLDADKLVAYFKEIVDEFGELDPNILLEKAKDKNNILHKYILWNDKKAAVQYRIEQIKSIIRSVQVIDESSNTQRAFVSVRVAEGCNKSYQPIDTVKTNEYARTILLQQAKRDAEIFMYKYQSLTELCGIIAEIKTFTTK